MNVTKRKLENGDVALRITHPLAGTGHDRHGAYHVTKDGIFRVYYSDNQKRFPIMQEVMEV